MRKVFVDKLLCEYYAIEAVGKKKDLEDVLEI